MPQRKTVLKRVMDQGLILNVSCKNFLLQHYTIEDVNKVVFGIRENKSLGPDGFGSFFFQDNWNIVGEDVGKANLSFLHTGQLLKEINTTNLTLIPKNTCLGSMIVFLPIVCYNVLYKIATKMICSRLRLILLDLFA